MVELTPENKIVWTSDANDDGWIATRIAAENIKAAKLGASVSPQSVDASGFVPASRLATPYYQDAAMTAAEVRLR